MTRRLLGLCLVCTLALTTGGCPDGLLSSNPTVTLAVDQTAIEADGGRATVTATLDAMSMRPVEVALEFGGTAMSGVTYTRSATKIVIPSYATSGTITIRGAGRGAYNPDAVVTVSAVSVTGGTLAADQQTLSIAIESDATQPVVSLSLPEGTTEFNEKDGTIDVTATLSNPTYQEVTVALAFAGTAINETDYTRTAETIVIAPGKTSGKVTLAGANPSEFVNHKSVVVSIDSVTNATETTEPAGQEVTAYLKDTSHTLPAATLELDETTIVATGGVATITCTLDKSIPVDATVEFSLDSSTTGKYDKNFTISDKIGDNLWQLTVPAGQTTGTLTITGKQRNAYFGDKTCVLRAGNTVNMTLDTAKKGPFTVTIEDRHAKPQVTLAVAGSPIAEDAGQATVTLTQSETTGADTTVTLTFAGTATNGTDYTASAASVKIPAGQLSQSITITARQDSLYEGNETVIVRINTVTNGEEAGDQQGTIVIIDGQTQPTVSLSLTSELLYESAGAAQITATLSNASKDDVTINLTLGGSAVQNTDYTISATTITIEAGDTEGAVVLQSIAGSHIGNTITVSLGAITNATAGTPSQVTATISDVSVTLGLTGSPIAENAGAATLTATLNKTIASSVQIQFGLTGSAVRDTDYTASGTSITIPAGQTTGTLTFTAIPDYTYDAGETIIISTQSVQNAAVVGNTQFTATITDDYAQAGQRWLDANADEPGVVVLPSGLQYKVVTAGPDPDDKPLVTDKATVNYVGTLMDGTQFDSNNNIEFTISGLIEGWQEALPLMSVGSNWILYVPANLGYGGTAHGNIPANSVLIFDMTLLSFTTP